MTQPRLWVEEALARIGLKHYHCEEDCWYCCGACGHEGGGCCDESRAGKCDCRLEQRQERIRAELIAAYDLGKSAVAAAATKEAAPE